MPNITFPHKDYPGYVTARRVLHPAGGWCVLFDRTKGFPAELPPVETTGRFILVHMPSWKWAGVETRKVAMRLLIAAARGEDAHGILPKTLRDSDQPLGGLEKPPGTAQDEGRTGSAGAGSAPAGARESEVPDALAFHRQLNERFTVSRIADEIDIGLSAMKTYQNKEGEIHEFPDPSTRVKYLDLLLKYRIGLADKRERPKEHTRFTKVELDRQIEVSPAMRRYLLEKIVKAGAAAEIKPGAALPAQA